MSLKVLNYSAQNVLRLDEIAFDLEGHNLFIVGGANSQGKSSAINALLMALCGRQEMDYPDVPLKAGASSGWIEVNIGGDVDGKPLGLKVELNLKRSRSGEIRETFRVTDEHGKSPPGGPRALLKRLFDLKAFDPLSFTKLSPKEQRAMLMRVVNLDTSDLDRSRADLYQQRTDANREVARLTGALAKAPKHADVPADEIDATALLAKSRELDRASAAHSVWERDRDELKLNITKREEAINVLRNQLRDLEASLEAKRGMLSAHEAAEPVKPSEAECEAIEVALRNSATINDKVRANKAHNDLASKLKIAEVESQDLSAKIDEIDARKQKMLEQAEWPIPGLSVDDEGVLYEGLPLAQSSKSIRTMLSFKIGMALNPQLKLLACQDGSDLDIATLAALNDVLAKEGFQAIIEVVTRTAADEELCSVIIENGACKVS